MLPPPEPFSLPVVLCPSCSHGVDPHGLEPGDVCGAGDLVEDDSGLINRLCMCLWSPNDIAAALLAKRETEVAALLKANENVATAEREAIAAAIEVLILPPRDHCHEKYNGGLIEAARIARQGGGGR